jgi:hypothetical protein
MSDEIVAESSEEESPETDIDTLRSELETMKKQFEIGKQERAGLDRKNSESAKQLTELQAALKAEKRKNMPFEKVRDLDTQEKAQELEELKARAAAAESKLAARIQRDAQIQSINKRSDIPPPLRRAFTEEWPSDPAQFDEFIDDLIKTDQAERVAAANADRVPSRPRSGTNATGARLPLPTDSEWERMGVAGRQGFDAPPEDLEKIIKKDVAK